MSSGKPARVFRDFHIDDAADRHVAWQGRAHAGRVQSTLVATCSNAPCRHAWALYEDLYCARVKPRTASASSSRCLPIAHHRQRWSPISCRMSFSAMAYVLVDTLRRVGLRHSQFADASVQTICPGKP